jgi:hypothetical protein
MSMGAFSGFFAWSGWPFHTDIDNSVISANQCVAQLKAYVMSFVLIAIS